MPRRSSSQSHLLRDAQGKLSDAAVTPLRTETPQLPQAEPQGQEFDMASYTVLRRATKLAERLIGSRAVRRTKKGERLVHQIVGYMRCGDTLALERLRLRHQQNFIADDLQRQRPKSSWIDPHGTWSF